MWIWFVDTCSLARFTNFSCPSCYSLSPVEKSSDRRILQIHMNNYGSGKTSDYRLTQAEKLQLLWRVKEFLKKKQNSSHYIITYFQESATSSPFCQVAIMLFCWVSGPVYLCLFVPHLHIANLHPSPISAVALNCERPILPSCQIHWHHISLLPLLFSILLGEWI